MTRQQVIETIQMLYPADSEFPNTAGKGKELLSQARQDVPWRDESDDVLYRYMRLCIEEEARVNR